jgi:transposase
MSHSLALENQEQKCPKIVPKLSRSERMAKAKPEAIILLASGLSINETARRVGVHERTIDNWLHNPEFQDEVHRATFKFGIAQAAERMRVLNKLARKMVAEERLEELAKNATVSDLLNILKHAGELEKQQPTITIEEFERMLIDAGWTPPLKDNYAETEIEIEAKKVEKRDNDNGYD